MRKAQSAFQNYILGKSTIKAPHSAAGALLATCPLYELSKELKLKKLPRTAQLLAYAISGHHRGLYDSEGLQSQLKGIDCKDRYEKTSKVLSGLRSEVQIWVKDHAMSIEDSLRELSKQVGVTEQAQALIRLLFSCLVDADFLDTEAFMDEERKVRRHDATCGYTSLKDLRAFLDQCRAHGRTCAKGYYSLFLPTGGGKTLSSMAWALETALKHEAQRIIYVIPYTSIITQTAGIFREIFVRRMYWSITQISPSLGMKPPKRQNATNAPVY